MLSRLPVAALIGCQLLAVLEAKVYSKCEFVRVARRNFPASEVDDWTCIAKYESNYNAQAIRRV